MRILVAVLALVSAGSAQAYSWPLKPFNRQHPVGGNFGDPRMTFLLTLGQNGLEGPGAFGFHNGIDIHAKPGTPVYPIASGRAHLLSGTAVAVRTPGRPTFQYFHLKLAVHNGQSVRRHKTILGYITVWAKHVHLSEIAHGRALNPLERGRIAPYVDTTRPRVSSVVFRDMHGHELSSLGAHGRIDVFADAFDLPEPLPAFTLRLPVSPAEVSWTLRRAGGLPRFQPAEQRLLARLRPRHLPERTCLRRPALQEDAGPLPLPLDAARPGHAPSAGRCVRAARHGQGRAREPRQAQPATRHRQSLRLRGA